MVVQVRPENLDRQKLPRGAQGKDVWRRRYREINDWERYLTDNEAIAKAENKPEAAGAGKTGGGAKKDK